MLPCVLTRYLLESLWDQKVPGSNPGPRLCTAKRPPSHSRLVPPEADREAPGEYLVSPARGKRRATGCVPISVRAVDVTLEISDRAVGVTHARRHHQVDGAEPGRAAEVPAAPAPSARDVRRPRTEAEHAPPVKRGSVLRPRGEAGGEQQDGGGDGRAS